MNNNIDFHYKYMQKKAKNNSNLKIAQCSIRKCTKISTHKMHSSLENLIKK